MKHSESEINRLLDKHNLNIRYLLQELKNITTKTNNIEKILDILKKNINFNE